jgi:hypothetical protein
MADVTTEDRNSAIQLAAAFAWDVDYQAGVGVSALFIADGVYGYAGFEMRGTAAIDAFYSERQARGKRLSRHVFSVPHIVSEQDGSLSAWSVLTLYAADGEPPFAPNPIAIMDYQDRIVRTQRGLRYARRWVTPLFGHMPQLVAAQIQGDAQ